MIRIASLVFFLLSACLVAARPGLGDNTAMRCNTILENCASEFMSADFSTPGGIQILCSTTRPRIFSCIENVPEECSAYTSGPEVDMMRAQFDRLCGEGGCGLPDVMPCVAIMQESGATMCSVKERFLACDRNLPGACATDELYLTALVPFRTMLENTTC